MPNFAPQLAGLGEGRLHHTRDHRGLLGGLLDVISAPRRGIWKLVSGGNIESGDDLMPILGFDVIECRALLFVAQLRGIRTAVAFHPGPVNRDERERLKPSMQVHHGTA